MRGLPALFDFSIDTVFLAVGCRMFHVKHYCATLVVDYIVYN